VHASPGRQGGWGGCRLARAAPASSLTVSTALSRRAAVGRKGGPWSGVSPGIAELGVRLLPLGAWEVPGGSQGAFLPMALIAYLGIARSGTQTGRCFPGSPHLTPGFSSSLRSAGARRGRRRRPGQAIPPPWFLSPPRARLSTPFPRKCDAQRAPADTAYPP